MLFIADCTNCNTVKNTAAVGGEIWGDEKVLARLWGFKQGADRKVLMGDNGGGSHRGEGFDFVLKTCCTYGDYYVK